MIRKSGLILLVVVPALLALWLYLARNALVESVGEIALEKMTGAPAFLEGVSIDPFSLQAGFDELRLADPARPGVTTFKAGPAEFDLNGLQLFAGKIIIETMRLDGVEIGPAWLDGSGKDSAAAPPPPQDTSPTGGDNAGAGAGGGQSAPEAGNGAPAEQEQEEDPFSLDFPLPKLDLSALTRELDVERITSGQTLASDRAFDEAQAEVDQRSAALEKRLADADLESRVARIEKDAKAIDVSSKDPKKLKASLDALKRLGGDVKTVRTQVREISREASEGNKAVKAALARAQGELKGDVAAAMNLANLGDLEVSEIGRLLFGQAVQDQMNLLLSRFQKVKAMMGSDSDPQGDPPRRSGRWIGFPVTGRAYPGFAAEKMGFSGLLPSLAADGAQGSGQGGSEDKEAELTFSGTLLGLSSDAAVFGRPTILRGKASNARGENWVLDGRYDPPQGAKLEEAGTFAGTYTARATGRGVRLKRLPLGGGPLPERAESDNARIDLALVLEGGNPRGLLNMTARDARFHFAPPDPEAGPKEKSLKKNIAAIFQGIDAFSVRASVSSKDGKRRFRVSSSLDKAVSRGLKSLLGQRRAAAEARIRKQLEDRVEDKRRAVTGRMEAKMAPLQAKVRALEARQAALEKYLAKKQADAQQSLKQRAGGNLLKKLKLR